VRDSPAVANQLEGLIARTCTDHQSGHALLRDAGLAASVALVRLNRGTHIQTNAANLLMAVGAGMTLVL
jgi:hypothetical protein